MLKNDYLVAKIGVDTAENEPFQVALVGGAGLGALWLGAAASAQHIPCIDSSIPSSGRH